MGLGKYPALRTFDFIYDSLSHCNNNPSAQDVALAIDWSNQGGLVVFDWHWFAPCKESAFYTDDTTFRLSDGVTDIVRSPGMKYKHYAPASPLVLLEGEENAVADFLVAAQSQENCAILCYSEEKPLLNNKNIIDVGARDDLATQAQTLFSALRETNSMSVDVIYAHLPTQNGLGLALYNRLIRAAAHTIKHIN